jgi:hypothetical protein
MSCRQFHYQVDSTINIRVDAFLRGVELRSVFILKHVLIQRSLVRNFWFDPLLINYLLCLSSDVLHPCGGNFTGYHVLCDIFWNVDMLFRTGSLHDSVVVFDLFGGMIRDGWRRLSEGWNFFMVMSWNWGGGFWWSGWCSRTWLSIFHLLIAIIAVLFPSVSWKRRISNFHAAIPSKCRITVPTNAFFAKNSELFRSGKAGLVFIFPK